MDDHIIDGDAVRVVALHIAAAGVPDLDGTVFGRCHQPLALAVECHARDVRCVAIKCKNGIWVC
jgi:hypothetical protein